MITVFLITVTQILLLIFKYKCTYILENIFNVHNFAFNCASIFLLPALHVHKF